MSLFGGDGNASRSQSPYETESEQSHLSVPSSPSVETRASPPSAQNLNDLDQAIESDEGDGQFLIGSESDRDQLDDESPTRPNRFHGGPAAWRGHTAADRQVAASLEQIQNNDLAAHLYNAHALKRRVRRPPEELAGLKSWQSNEQWLKRGNELNYTDVSGETQTNLVPSKDWTAWPLPPASIPRPHTQAGRVTLARAQDGWSIGDSDMPDVGEDLREELLATFLRQAKERWSARETDDTPVREDTRTTQSRSRSRSKSAKFAPSKRSASGTISGNDDENLQTENAETQGEDDDDNDKFGHIIGKKRGRVAQPATFLRPMFLADDAKAQKTLQPTINSILSKLDDLAIAVRRTRLNHFGRIDYSDRSSFSEFTSGAESTTHTPRPRSSQSKNRPGSRQSSRPVSRATSVQSRRTATKTGTSNRDRLSSSDSSFDSDVVMEEPRVAFTSRKRSRAGSTADERSPSETRGEAWRAGLMDWSEVLGLAAVKGWDEKVLARTAQRCATLFGETVSFIPLDENLATKPVPEPVQYIPSTIPAPDILSTVRSSVPKRPLFRRGTLRCPHVGCYGYEKDFEAPYRVVQHCIRVHEYDPRTNDSDNEDRAVGGVHIDGYLQPIAAQRGWQERGKPRAASEKKRQKTVQAEDRDGDGDEVVTIESD
jgi:hypothetical protein